MEKVNTLLNQLYEKELTMKEQLFIVYTIRKEVSLPFGEFNPKPLVNQTNIVSMLSQILSYVDTDEVVEYLKVTILAD